MNTKAICLYGAKGQWSTEPPILQTDIWHKLLDRVSAHHKASVYAGQHNEKTQTLPRPMWDSNPWSQCTSSKRQYM